MHKNFIFNLQESIRNVGFLPKHSITFCLLLFLNYFIFIILFLAYINLKYLKEVVTNEGIPYLLNYFMFNSLDQIDIVILLLVLMIVVFLLINIYTNKTYIKKYYELNKHEMKLLLMLQGKKNLVRTSIIYTGLFINLLPIIFLINWVKVPYKRMFNLLNEKSSSAISLLEYNCFDTSLLILLLTTTVVIVISINHYLYWKLKKR
ncbi:MAG: hypothetical protein ACLFPF_07250 [Halanaerobiales bacterium]